MIVTGYTLIDIILIMILAIKVVNQNFSNYYLK